MKPHDFFPGDDLETMILAAMSGAIEPPAPAPIEPSLKYRAAILILTPLSWLLDRFGTDAPRDERWNLTLDETEGRL